MNLISCLLDFFEQDLEPFCLWVLLCKVLQDFLLSFQLFENKMLSDGIFDKLKQDEHSSSSHCILEVL